VAVDPALSKLRLIRAWRGDGVSTTAEDLVDKYEEIMKGVSHEQAAVFYDYAAADVGTIAQRRHIPFQKADKSREKGIPVINSLFKSGALVLYEPSEASALIPDEYLQSAKLAAELESLGVNQGKSDRGVVDDLADALRYAVVSIPLVWARGSIEAPIEVESRIITVDEMRRNPGKYIEKEEENVEWEMAFWSETMQG
jgi:hypothetical protein